MKKLIFMMILGAFFFTENALSECAAWGCKEKIKELMVQSSVVYITTEGNPAAANCTRHVGTYFVLPKTMGSFKEAYAALLAAKITGTPIMTRIVEGSSNCEVAYVAFY